MLLLLSFPFYICFRSFTLFYLLCFFCPSLILFCIVFSLFGRVVCPLLSKVYVISVPRFA